MASSKAARTQRQSHLPFLPDDSSRFRMRSPAPPLFPSTPSRPKRRPGRPRKERPVILSLPPSEEGGHALLSLAIVAAAPDSAAPSQRKYHDWVQEGRLPIIHDAVTRYGSIYAAVSHLKRIQDPLTHTGPFSALTASTVKYWYERRADGSLALIPRLAAVLQGQGFHWKNGNGREPFHLRQPQCTACIIADLHQLAEEGVPLQSSTMERIFMATMLDHCPAELSSLGPSRAFIRRFVRHVACMSFRRGSTCGQKVPGDWEAQVEYLHEKACWMFLTYAKGDPAFVINLDHTSVQLLPASKRTYAPLGAKEVRTNGLDDKRQFTGVLACSLAGNMLPLQVCTAVLLLACTSACQYMYFRF